MFRACVKAEAATLLTAFEVLGLLNNLEALEATDFDVDSFFDFAIVLKFNLAKLMSNKNTINISCQTERYKQMLISVWCLTLSVSRMSV